MAVVDETFVRAHYPGESRDRASGSASARRGPQDGPVKWMEIVGVVSHVKNYGVDQESRVEVYLPYLPEPGRAT